MLFLAGISSSSERTSITFWGATWGGGFECEWEAVSCGREWYLRAKALRLLVRARARTRWWMAYCWQCFAAGGGRGSWGSWAAWYATGGESWRIWRSSWYWLYNAYSSAKFILLMLNLGQ
jgi:hypothetical protein